MICVSVHIMDFDRSRVSIRRNCYDKPVADVLFNLKTNDLPLIAKRCYTGGGWKPPHLTGFAARQEKNQ
jgi:hypothetical protein